MSFLSSLIDFPTFGMFLTILAFFVGVKINQAVKSPLANPLLLGMLFVMLALVVTGIDPAAYQASSAKYISYFLSPATIALAIPAYKQYQVLKQNMSAVLVAVFVGALVGALSIVVIGNMMGAEELFVKSNLAKSSSTAIAVAVTDIIGGESSIVVGSTVITAVIGIIVYPFVYKICGVKSQFALGLGLGNSSLAMGAGEAAKNSDVAGAAGSLGMVLGGLLTAVLVPILNSIFL